MSEQSTGEPQYRVLGKKLTRAFQLLINPGEPPAPTTVRETQKLQERAANERLETGAVPALEEFIPIIETLGLTPEEIPFFNERLDSHLAYILIEKDPFYKDERGKLTKLDQETRDGLRRSFFRNHRTADFSDKTRMQKEASLDRAAATTANALSDAMRHKGLEYAIVGGMLRQFESQGTPADTAADVRHFYLSQQHQFKRIEEGFADNPNLRAHRTDLASLR